jgi:hypothetical protein
MEWTALRKVMMWIGIVGGGLGAVGLGVWKIKDHYDQKRVAEVKEEKELDQLMKKAERGERLTDDELDRLGAVAVPSKFIHHIEKQPEPIAPDQKTP